MVLVIACFSSFTLLFELASRFDLFKCDNDLVIIVLSFIGSSMAVVHIETVLWILTMIKKLKTC